MKGTIYDIPSLRMEATRKLNTRKSKTIGTKASRGWIVDLLEAVIKDVETLDFQSSPWNTEYSMGTINGIIQTAEAIGLCTHTDALTLYNDVELYVAALKDSQSVKPIESFDLEGIDVKPVDDVPQPIQTPKPQLLNWKDLADGYIPTESDLKGEA